MRGLGRLGGLRRLGGMGKLGRMRRLRGLGRLGRMGGMRRLGAAIFFQKKVFKFLSIEKNLLTCDHNI
ncbi:hypothetical protein [Capnocytophaga leadbetteri]|uniref:hypothetical protein n=1 Tax=Capnocytophaga leadbetteri TaxID=327575 RepID=UPI00288A7B18|nr:hypothetical protein [Capnocytophaga leadbetteri]